MVLKPAEVVSGHLLPLSDGVGPPAPTVEAGPSPQSMHVQADGMENSAMTFTPRVLEVLTNARKPSTRKSYLSKCTHFFSHQALEKGHNP